MTTTQLEYVVAVATYNTFAPAAEKSFVTQSTPSMQTHKPDEELGVKLFDTNKHPIAITAMGEAIVKQAKAILAESERITELIQQQQSKVSGIFKLAVIPTIAPYILPGFLEKYSHKFPDVKLVVKEMETSQIITALNNNELDAALVSTPMEENGIKEYPLFFEPFVAYFSSDEKALAKRTINADDIALERLWLLNEGHCMRNQVLDLCSDHVQRLQADKPYSYESSNVETLRKMVDKSKGLTILPELATFEFTEDQMERVRYFTDPEPVREISIVTNNYFVRLTLLQTIIDEIIELVPEKMRVQKKSRKILRIQSAKL